MQRITIKDVAREAGCGVSTASRVLNASGPVSAEVRERVSRAAQELGFSFSSIGRALQSRRSMTVGCIVPSLTNPVFAEAVQGVQSVLQEAGYQLLISSSGYDGTRDTELLHTLMANDVDGLIATIVAPECNEALRLARNRGLPLCLMFHDPVAGYPTSHVDNTLAAREVGRRFAALGHRRTAFLALRFSSSDRSRNRYAGFAAACRDCGLPEPRLLELTEAEARDPDVLTRRLDAHADITAIFASNDLLAIAVLSAARLLGRRVPADLSVVGFDGIAAGRLLDTPIATIQTNPEEMGRRAARALLDEMRGGQASRMPPLPFTFQPGGTLAAPGSERNDDGQVAPRPSSVRLAKVEPQTRMNR